MLQTFYLSGKSLSTHWMGGWVGPRARLDRMDKKEHSLPGIKLGIPSRSPSPYRLSHPDFLTKHNTALHKTRTNEGCGV
jgi:hypothetical protein